QEVWQYQHRPIEYADAPDHFLDLGISGPIGLKNSGFLLGVKYNRILPVFPTIRGYDQVLSFEGKFNFQLAESMNLMVSGLYGETETSTMGDNWGDTGILDYGYDINSSNPSVNSDSRYYLAYNNPLDVKTTQIGARFTHTLNSSTFYEVKYSYFTSDSESKRAEARSTAGVKTIGGVEFDEGPIGWVHSSESLQDVTGTYAFSGGGRVTDISSAKSHLINFDMTSQLNNAHMLKFGLMFGSDNVIKNHRKAASIILDPEAGNFINFDYSPYQVAGYVQDKIEYGGLIANIGLRVEHFAANGPVYAPDEFYSMLWADGGTLEYPSPSELPQEDSKSFTTIAPRLSFSHPISEFVKFFFNFGVYYSEPTTLARYGLMFHEYNFGHPNSDVREFGSPNLEPAKTSAYEVGFEQSIGNEWLLKAYLYSKDNSQHIGSIIVTGLA
ncbi:MAG: TonB-dependent receptor, partial [Melioribacteraceae bacterium]|nr:TonB-dependent receptor [Melioribacteraceae bacterium]